MKKMLLILTLLGLALSACTKQEVITVPVKYCQQQATGRTDTTTSFQCMPMGNNPCGMQLPIVNTIREVEVTCAYREWR